MSNPTPTERQRVAGLALQLVREHCPELETMLRIEWSERFTSRLGDATFRRMQARMSDGTVHTDPRMVRFMGGTPPLARVRFSTKLWAVASGDERDNTVAHEVAHLVVFWRHYEAVNAAVCAGRKPPRMPAGHGREWRNVMLDMGHDPHRTHNVILPDARVLVCTLCAMRYPVGPKRYANAQKAHKARLAGQEVRGGYLCRCHASRVSRTHLIPA